MKKFLFAILAVAVLSTAADAFGRRGRGACASCGQAVAVEYIAPPQQVAPTRAAPKAKHEHAQAAVPMYEVEGVDRPQPVRRVFGWIRSHLHLRRRGACN